MNQAVSTQADMKALVISVPTLLFHTLHQREPTTSSNHESLDVTALLYVPKQPSTMLSHNT